MFFRNFVRQPNGRVYFVLLRETVQHEISDGRRNGHDGRRNGHDGRRDGHDLSLIHI